MSKKAQKKEQKIGPLDFDGAAIVNPDGSETPITDEMIEKACNDLESISENEDKAQHQP